MKCPVCPEKGLKSNVYPGHRTSTLMYCSPYYDENGKYHHHDMNTSTYSYSCSRGHTWSVISNGKCPSCDFGHEPDGVRITKDTENPLPEKLQFSDGSLLTTLSGTGSSMCIVTGNNGICSSISAIPQFITLTK